MICDRYQNHVRLNLPGFANVLLLQRTPVFLRFTLDGKDQWDALDQLDDEPRPDEQVVVAKLAGTTSLHIDRVVNRRRVGEWIKMLDYEPLAEQPPDEVVRDTVKWRAWCEAQMENKHGAVQAVEKQQADADRRPGRDDP